MNLLKEELGRMCQLAGIIVELDDTSNVLLESNCINTQLLLENKISKKEYSNHIQTLEEGLMDALKTGKDAFVKWFKENILTKLITFIKKAVKGVKEELSIISFGLKKLLALVTKFKEKHPFLFKLAMIALFIIVFLVITTASAQAQDPAGMGYSPNSLDAMHGLVEHYTPYLEESGFDNFDIMMAQTYLKDLKDGTLTFSDYSEDAKKIASGIENVFRDLRQTVKASGGPGIEGGDLDYSHQEAYQILMDAFKSGKNSVMQAGGYIFK